LSHLELLLEAPLLVPLLLALLALLLELGVEAVDLALELLDILHLALELLEHFRVVDLQTLQLLGLAG